MITAKQVAKLAQICAEINREPTKRDVTGDKPTVFFIFSGHTAGVSIDVHLHGWSAGIKPDYSYIFFNAIGWRKETPDDCRGKRSTFGQVVHDLQKLKERSK